MPDGNEVQAHLADGTTLHFPAGTDPGVITNVARNHIAGSQTQMPAQPVAPLPKEMQPIQSYGNYGGKFNPSMVPANIEQAGQQQDVRESNLAGREQKAQQSLTPMSNAIGILEPVTAARQIVGGKVGGYAGDKIKPGGTGEAIGGLLGGILAGNANEPDQIRRGTQKTLGVGPDFIRAGAEKVGEENAELVGKHQEATAKATADADAKFERQKQTVQQANQEAERGFNERQQHLSLASQNAQEISDALPQMHQAARAEASAAYGPQPKGTYETQEIKSLIEDTAKAKLQGNTQMPGAITKILKDIDQPPPPTLLDQASVFKGAGKAGRAAGTLDDLSPKARAKFYEQNPEAEREMAGPESTATTPPVDAQRIHGFMSELGRAAQSGSLNGDEASAINATRTALEGRLRKLYDNEGRLGDFTKGQAAWKQMANTFENASSPAKGGSPIAQALQTKDPVTGKLRPDYVQAAMTGEKSYPVAKELLNRYGHLGDLTNALDGMKTHADIADTLPDRVKLKAPAERTPPKNIPPPSLADYDPIEARKVALKQKGASLAGTGGPYGVMRDVMGMKGALMGNPMALAYPALRRILGSEVGSEGLTNWLSKATPEELQMAKEIPAKKVALKKASGK